MAVEPNHSHSKEIVMTAINTNTAALNAQYYLAKSNKDMESSMAKLRLVRKLTVLQTTPRAWLLPAATAQIRGLAMAVKNSNILCRSPQLLRAPWRSHKHASAYS